MDRIPSVELPPPEPKPDSTASPAHVPEKNQASEPPARPAVKPAAKVPAKTPARRRR